MRVQAGDKRLYNEDGPKYWSPRADAVWRATPELEANADDPVTIKDGVAVFSLDGPIYDVSARVGRFFSSVSSTQPVRFDINSPGGLVDEGTAIRSMMLRHEGPVLAQVLGVAASAAQFLTTGASDINMAESSMMMIHRPWSMAILVGDYEQMQAEATTLVKFMKQHTQTYEKALAKRMQIPQSRVAELLKSETWYTAEEAVEAKLADRVHPVAQSAEEPEEETSGDVVPMAVMPSVEQLVRALTPAL